MRWLRFCAAGAVIVVILLAFAPSVGAATSSPTSGSTSSSFICSQKKTTGSSAANYLPINRWASAASTQHSRLTLNLFNIGNLPDVVQRNFIVAGAQSIGNTFWEAGVGLTEDATKFCFGDSVATTADGITAKIGRALSSAGIIVIVLLAAIVLIIVRLRRGDTNARHQIVKIIVVLLVFAVMVNGASQTKTNADGSVSFGFGSPGWVITHIYTAASTVASAPAAALSGIADSLNFGSTTSTKVDSEDPLACGNYLNNLRTDYRDAYGSTASTNIDATVPLALDSMWEQSGLTTYAYSQFGADNDYADLMYCRLLEANANIPPATQVKITDQTSGAAAILAGSKDAGGAQTALAWASDQNLGASPDDTVDESMVGWAACQTNSTSFTPMEWSASTGQQVTSEWTKVVDPNASGSAYGATGTVTPQLCSAFFNKPWTGFGPQQTALEWGDNTTQIATAANPGNGQGPFTGFNNYVTTLHGTANGPAEMLSIMFLISSLVDLLVFGVMAGAVFVAKFSLLFLMAFAALLLLLSLWPGASASSRLAAIAKHAFSMVLFVTGAQLILSIVAITTSIIMDTGNAIAGQGSFLALLWMGIAPIAAIFIIHHLFKQVLKAPSPFKMSSALAWGAASGGIGAGVVSGIDRYTDHKKVWGTAKRGLQAGRSAAGSLKRHSMEPIGSAAQEQLETGKKPPSPTNGALPAAEGSRPDLPARGQTGASARRRQDDDRARSDANWTDTTAVLGARHTTPALPAGNGHSAAGSRAGSNGDGDSIAGDTRRQPAGVAGPHRREGEPAIEGPTRDGIPGGETSNVIDAEEVAGAAEAGLGVRALLRKRANNRKARASSVGEMYQSALQHVSRHRGMSLDEDGALNTRTGRRIGAARNGHGGSIGAGVDARSMAERVHDDRMLHRAAIRTGRAIRRQELSARASANALGRFASSEHATAASKMLSKGARAIGAPDSVRGRTIQRAAERTRRATQEFRSRPLHRQIAGVAKVGAMGLAGIALMASPPALGIASGAYAARRAYKARFGLDAIESRNQRHIATFRTAAAADRTRRHEEARRAALEQRSQEPAEGTPVPNQPSSELPPPRDTTEHWGEEPHEWTPPAEQQAQPPASQPSSAAHTSKPQNGRSRAPVHHPPASAAEVLRGDAGRAAPDDARSTTNEPKTPSHLVGNRVPNHPPSQDEVPPDVRERFDTLDEAGFDED